MHNNKVFLVTGAANGIGLAIAKQAISGGATVIASDINGDALEQSQKLLGEKYIPKISDASDPKAIEELVRFIETDFGRLDVLVNNAGAATLNNPETITEDVYDFQMNLLLKGPVFFVKYAAPLLRAANNGVVVNISSASAILQLPGYCPYGMAKEALVKFTEDCVITVPGIRHNVILPGVIDTLILNNTYGKDASDEFKKVVETSCPVPRLGTPDDIADGVLFLSGILSVNCIINDLCCSASINLHVINCSCQC